MMKSSCAKTCGACSATAQKAKDTKARPKVEAQPPGREERRENKAPRDQGGGRQSACLDLIPNCAAVVAKTPEACVTAPLMKTSCEKSCGLCGGGRRVGKDEL
jgi:hypothetical protein